MKHRARKSFWEHYDRLPEKIKALADKNFDLLKRDPRHPSLQLKKAGRLWSARVGLDFRILALGLVGGAGMVLDRSAQRV